MRSTKAVSRTRTRLIGAVATVALAGAVGLGAVGTGTAPVLADPVKLENPVQAPSFADVVELVTPAVVSVRVSGERLETGPASAPFFDMPGFENLPDGHPLKRFFEEFRRDWRSERPRRPRVRPISQGSGFFISEDGYLVTNNHVIQGGSEYTVVMEDGTELSAELVGTDPRTDLAVLKVDGEGRTFTYVDFADDARVRVGDWVVAVGNPFGLGGTVTAGIVSARGREIGAGPYDDFIQIDAAVNRGNSGGPAFNLAGEVVGVNTAIFSPSGGNVGIAFAIPASLARSVVEQLIEDGKVERGWLGVQIQQVTKEIAESLGLDEDKGALIVDANEGEPAAEAGVQPGDVVIAVDGKNIDSPRDLARTIAEYDPGQSVELTVWRNGKATNLDVTLGEMPSSEQMAALPGEAPSATETDFGLTVTPAEEGPGLVVTDVEPGSAAEDVGIRPGDVIRSVNSQPVSSVSDLQAAVDAAAEAGRGAVLLQVERDNANRFMALPIG
ncbi:Do family serine endopeptidase [Chelativorans intermedius]|uniref:Do family serine endopeptidase n=1 Tax=Chelativorans intermedius TaxID=515947 RepID=A0ABV6DCB2_9HYPH|nr:Do family serine endopeptidase [Chelativorans intermedius]MCT8999662.1 Do family serine endopeptidase [Chelativorans intermedius]